MVTTVLQGGLLLLLALHAVMVMPGQWAKTMPPLVFVIMDITEMVLPKFLVQLAQREATVTEMVTLSVIAKQTIIPKQDTRPPVWEPAEHAHHSALQTGQLLALFVGVKLTLITLNIMAISFTMDLVTPKQILAIHVL